MSNTRAGKYPPGCKERKCVVYTECFIPSTTMVPSCVTGVYIPVEDVAFSTFETRASISSPPLACSLHVVKIVLLRLHGAIEFLIHTPVSERRHGRTKKKLKKKRRITKEKKCRGGCQRGRATAPTGYSPRNRHMKGKRT